MLYSGQIKRKCGTLHNAWHLWLKKRDGHKAECTTWQQTLPDHSAQPQDYGHTTLVTEEKAEEGSVLSLGPAIWMTSWFHFSPWANWSIMTFWKNLSQLCQQASLEKHTPTKTCDHPTWVIKQSDHRSEPKGERSPWSEKVRCSEYSHNHCWQLPRTSALPSYSTCSLQPRKEKLIELSPESYPEGLRRTE